MFITGQRASSILYNFIKTFPDGIYLVPANVCPVVPLTFSLAKVPFEFVDLDPETFCIDEQKCIDLVSSKSNKYAGIVFVRTYGYIYDSTGFYDNLYHLNKDFKIIDDRCLCVPNLSIKTDNCDLVLFSTGYGKPVNVGKGGIGILNDSITINKFYENATSDTNLEKIISDSFSNMSILVDSPSGWLDTSDLEINIHDYLYKIESEKIKIIEHKKHLNYIYQELLPPEIVMPKGFHDWRFNIIVNNKDRIIKKIFENSLFASSHFKPSSLLFESNNYTVATKLYNQIINLFNDFNFSEKQAESTCYLINKNLR